MFTLLLALFCFLPSHEKNWILNKSICWKMTKAALLLFAVNIKTGGSKPKYPSWVKADMNKLNWNENNSIFGIRKKESLHKVWLQFPLNENAPESAAATTFHKSLPSSLTASLCLECTLKGDIFRFLPACLCCWLFVVLDWQKLSWTALSLNAHSSYFTDCAFRTDCHQWGWMDSWGF